MILQVVEFSALLQARFDIRSKAMCGQKLGSRRDREVAPSSLARKFYKMIKFYKNPKCVFWCFRAIQLNFFSKIFFLFSADADVYFHSLLATHYAATLFHEKGVHQMACNFERYLLCRNSPAPR